MSRDYKKRSKSTARKTYKEYSQEYNKLKQKGVSLNNKLTPEEFNKRYNEIINLKKEGIIKSPPFQQLMREQKRMTYKQYLSRRSKLEKIGNTKKDILKEKEFEEAWNYRVNKLTNKSSFNIMQSIMKDEIAISNKQAENIAKASEEIFNKQLVLEDKDGKPIGTLPKSYTVNDILSLGKNYRDNPYITAILIYIGNHKKEMDIYGGHYE